MELFHLHRTKKTAFFPVSPLAESTAKTFCWLFLWNFKEKSTSHFYDRLCHSVWWFHLHSTVKRQPFSPVFPLAESIVETFFWLFIWNFKKKSISHFLRYSLMIQPNFTTSKFKTRPLRHWTTQIRCSYAFAATACFPQPEESFQGKITLKKQNILYSETPAGTRRGKLPFGTAPKMECAHSLCAFCPFRGAAQIFPLQTALQRPTLPPGKARSPDAPTVQGRQPGFPPPSAPSPG